MKPRSPKKRDSKPNCKTGKVKESKPKTRGLLWFKDNEGCWWYEYDWTK